MGVFTKRKMEKELTVFIVDNKESFYRLAYTYVKNKEDALDVVQDSIHKALLNIGKLEDRGAIKSWFYKIVVRTALDHLRKHKRVTVADDKTIEFYTNGKGDDYHYVDLEEAIEHLPDKLRTIIILRYFEDMKIEDIAGIMDENISTVKTRLYKALKMLKMELDDDESGRKV